jgi:hypothetical protein
MAYSNATGAWAETTLSGEVEIPDGTGALEEFYVGMTASLDLTGFSISSRLKPTVKRIAATGGTEYTGSVFINQVGAHLLNDTPGSRLETSK